MAINFDEVRLPPEIALGARGGPERRTEIVTLDSGFEHRNQLWQNSRRRWDIGYGLSSLAQLEAILVFFEARRGRMRGFRFKDRLDFRSASAGAPVTPTDQAIGIGDGDTAAFQLIKHYGSGDTSYARPIRKPVIGTVLVAVGGTPKAVDEFILDASTGLITFAPGHLPAEDEAVTAGFQFDVPVRFDSDFLELDAAAFEAGAIPSIPIIEVLP
jgi:uncharacterized protein (TIGR02217 family)